MTNPPCRRKSISVGNPARRLGAGAELPADAPQRCRSASCRFRRHRARGRSPACALRASRTAGRRAEAGGHRSSRPSARSEPFRIAAPGRVGEANVADFDRQRIAPCDAKRADGQAAVERPGRVPLEQGPEVHHGGHDDRRDHDGDGDAEQPEESDREAFAGRAMTADDRGSRPHLVPAGASPVNRMKRPMRGGVSDRRPLRWRADGQFI